MSARAVLMALLLLAVSLAPGCGRGDRTTPKQLQAQIETLQKERDTLRARLDALMQNDPMIQGMPQTPVRVGVPTSLARELITKVVSGFVDQVTLELKNLKVKKTGNVKKIVTIGQYDLQVRIHKVTGKLKTGKPEVVFGGNKVTLKLPVQVVSGSGRATINFKWDGKNVSGAVCGDMDIEQQVSGGVKPATYPVSGGLELTATAREIMAAPRFPAIKVNLKVEPSKESWGAVEKILADKEGICGYVVEKVNVLRIVEALIDKGFKVRLPTEKIKPMAIPVGIEPSMTVKGQQVELAIKLSELAITEKMIWLGANIAIELDKLAVPATPSAQQAAPAAAPAKPAAPSAAPPKPAAQASAPAKPAPATKPTPAPATPAPAAKPAG